MEENNKINMPTLAAAIAYTNSHGGGGGGGTSNYNDLSNKPQIGGTTLTGNKSASDLGLVAAVEGKGLSTNDYTDADKAIVGGVTAALAGKQGTLSAGSHIDIDSNTVSVQRWAVPAGKVVYTVITSDENYGQNVHVQRHTTGGALIDDRVYFVQSWQTKTVDDVISIADKYGKYEITLLKNSDEQSAGYSYIVQPTTTPTSNSFTFMMEQEENDNDLIIREELDAVSSAVSAIKDGQSIDSFADVETALAGKQATLTFDDAPTDGSNNPVKSNGIYDALATKANTDMVAADFNTGTSYTAGNYCIYEGKFYKFKASHSGAWSAADVDEIKIAGELSSLKSGLTNVNTALDVPAGTGKNLAFKKISNATINESGEIESNNGYNLFVAKVSNGEAYTATKGSDYIVYSFYSTEPVIGSTSYDDSRVVEENDPDHPNTFTVTAPISGYIAFRSVVAYTDGQLEKGSTATPYTPYIPSVETRLETVESGVSSLLSSDLLFSGAPTTDNTFESKSLGSGKKFSDYQFIVVIGNHYNNSRVSLVEPTHVFRQQTSNQSRIIMTDGTVNTTELYYVSDTSFMLKQSSSDVTSFKTSIYGMLKTN